MIKKIVLGIIILGVTFTILLQLVPYGRNHTNPPIVQEPQWDTPQTRALVSRACFDCHSNETVWPWYSNIAPVSWLVQADVDGGRQTLNFSEWGTTWLNYGEIGEVVAEGRMPPGQYLIMHPEARLNQAEKDALLKGLQSSIK
jgi:hypothetical protein